jgi:hypothetical protein
MGVTNVSFSGRVRTSLTAISDRIPVVGSLQVPFIGKHFAVGSKAPRACRHTLVDSEVMYVHHPSARSLSTCCRGTGSAAHCTIVA